VKNGLVVATVVGLQVVRNVSPLLHAPLMSLTIQEAVEPNARTASSRVWQMSKIRCIRTSSNAART
jgi:hypothetical protein